MTKVMQSDVNPLVKLLAVESSLIFLRVCNNIIYPALTNQNILLFQIFPIIMVEFFFCHQPIFYRKITLVRLGKLL